MYSGTIHTDAQRRRYETVTRTATQSLKEPKETGLIVPTWALKKVREGRITQLRFPVFPIPTFDRDDNVADNYWMNLPFGGLLLPKRRDMWMENPFGIIGDRLWVKEQTVVLTADRSHLRAFPEHGVKYAERLMSAHNMRRAHCRTVLELTAMPRVERQQLILTRDCLAEGIYNGGSVRAKYIARYERIHGEGSWNENPWVWALKFKVVQHA